MSLKWTTEKPTVPGQYWVNDGGRSKRLPRIRVELLMNEPGGLWWDGYGEDGFVEECDYFTHFAGPIPEPEE